MQQKIADYQKNKTSSKNPVVAELFGLSSNIDFTESKLESSILTHIQKFLLELGKGYAFVARQQHISTDVGDFCTDLVFYNYMLKDFLLIDLKTTKITHQDVRQKDIYMQILKRTEGDNPTFGLNLCSQTSKDVAKYSVFHEESKRKKEIFQIQQDEKI